MSKKPKSNPSPSPEPEVNEFEQSLMRIREAKEAVVLAKQEVDKASALRTACKEHLKECISILDNVENCELAELPLFPRKAGPVATSPAAAEPAPAASPEATTEPTSVAPAEPADTEPVTLQDQRFGLGKTLADKLAAAGIADVPALESYLAKGGDLAEIDGMSAGAARRVKGLLANYHAGSSFVEGGPAPTDSN